VEALEAGIQEREKAVEALAWRLGDPELWRDPVQTRALEADRARLQEEIAAAYADWERAAAELDALARSGAES
jgi:hypothetical protein